MTDISDIRMGIEKKVYLYDCIVTTVDVVRQGRDVNCFHFMLSVVVLRILVINHMAMVGISVLALCFAPLLDWLFRSG